MCTAFKEQKGWRFIGIFKGGGVEGGLLVLLGGKVESDLVNFSDPSFSDPSSILFKTCVSMGTTFKMVSSIFIVYFPDLLFCSYTLSSLVSFVTAYSWRLGQEFK